MKKQRWQDLEESVCLLFQAAGGEASMDEIIDHQQIDVLWVRRDLGEEKRTAVECKAYKKRLTKEQVATVFVKYESLYEKHLIEDVLLVTENGLTANAKAFVRAKRGLKHLTHAELQASIIDFSGHCRQLMKGYEDDGLSAYYVPMRAISREGTGSRDLMEIVREWMTKKRPRPLALLSSYGMGKTTFSRHLASVLAKEWFRGPHRRIPILIDLGAIADEVTLEGLVARVLAGKTPAPGYSFELFMELNERGKFVIILDSFDEMTHGISWATLLRNSNELRRLVVKDSRVLLCGRPSLFLSEEEGREILDGQHALGTSWVQYSAFSGFREISLAPLSNLEAEQIIQGYLAFTDPENGAERAQRALKRLQEEGGGALRDVARRPVLVRMLASVLPEWDQPLDRLSVNVIFNHFIDQSIRRETAKHARTDISAPERRKFLRDLAWLVWNDSGRDHLRLDDIPDAFFHNRSNPQKLGPLALKREYVLGSGVDVKGADLLVFPHRSILEYLVAEELSNRLLDSKKRPSLESALSEQVNDFLIPMTSPDALEHWAYGGFDRDAWIGHETERLLWAFPDVWERLASLRSLNESKAPNDSPWPDAFFFRLCVETENTLAPKTPDLAAHERIILANNTYNRLLRRGPRSSTLFGLHLFLWQYFGLTLQPNKEPLAIRDLQPFLDDLHRVTRSSLPNSVLIRSVIRRLNIHRKSRRIEFGSLRKALVSQYRSSKIGFASMLMQRRSLGPLYELLPWIEIGNTSQLAELGDFLEKMRAGSRAKNIIVDNR